MRNCAKCSYAHMLQSSNIRCFLAHKTITDVHAIFGQGLTELKISAPEWCPKREE